MGRILTLAGAIAVSVILIILIWLRKGDPEGIKRIAGVRSYKKAMALAIIALLLSSALMAYVIYFLWNILKE
jgi:preprotein translocase subunit SecG